jgi:Arc/MetJ-type ribon-helix-helix transcriptional regulator
MARMISVRLDDEAQRALESLTADGRSRSDAIRDALVRAAARRSRRSLSAEAMRLGADPEDRAAVAEVLADMEALDTEG